MIVYMLKDGLGNQLFEYAYAKKLGESLGDEKIKFCTFLYRLPNFSLGGTRQVSLQNYKLSTSVSICNELANVYWFCLFMLRLAIVYKKDFISWFIKGKRVSRKDKYVDDCKRGLYISESSFEIPKQVQCKKRIKFVFGNYESTDTLPVNNEKMKKELTLAVAIGSEQEELIKKVRTTESVCVHVRRGDYMNPGNEWLQVCDFSYYKRAIEYMNSHISNPVFFIFSNTHNDLEWIKENYDFGIKPVYVDMNNKDYEELTIMSSCRHFIISNSTFSWWASYLSDSEKKIIVSPSVWSKKDALSLNMMRKDFVQL